MLMMMVLSSVFPVAEFSFSTVLLNTMNDFCASCGPQPSNRPAAAASPIHTPFIVDRMEQKSSSPFHTCRERIHSLSFSGSIIWSLMKKAWHPQNGHSEKPSSAYADEEYVVHGCTTHMEMIDLRPSKEGYEKCHSTEQPRRSYPALLDATMLITIYIYRLARVQDALAWLQNIGYWWMHRRRSGWGQRKRPSSSSSSVRNLCVH